MHVQRRHGSPLPPPSLHFAGQPPRVPMLALLLRLQDLVERCTRWDPDERPTFQDVLAALRAAAGAAEPSAPPTPASVVSPF